MWCTVKWLGRASHVVEQGGMDARCNGKQGERGVPVWYNEKGCLWHVTAGKGRTWFTLVWPTGVWPLLVQSVGHSVPIHSETGQP